MNTTQQNRFKTVSTTLQGALCGYIWLPEVKATLQLTKDLRSEFERFSTSDISFRDALLHVLMENGGDFQDASFTADTSLVIKRVRRTGADRYETRVREIEVSRLKDCADLVDAEMFSWDFSSEE